MYNYKPMNLTKSRIYVKGYTNYYICIKLDNSSIKMECKKDQITK